MCTTLLAVKLNHLMLTDDLKSAVWLCLYGMLPFEEFTHQHGYATCPPRLSLYSLYEPKISLIYQLAIDSTCQGVGPLTFINDAIRTANPFWHQSNCVCHPYGSSQVRSNPTQSPIPSARWYTILCFTQYGFLMKSY